MKRKEKERGRRSPLLYLVFAAVVLSFLSSFFLGQNGILRLRNLRAQYEERVADNHNLALENRMLMEEIRKLREDPTAIEKIAREELNFVSPHDLVLVVPEQPQQNSH